MELRCSLFGWTDEKDTCLGVKEATACLSVSYMYVGRFGKSVNSGSQWVHVFMPGVFPVCAWEKVREGVCF